ncbi:uncharacterized protein LOC111343280, partial [Stylophora pistillata]|uniref:uncharacterized protein LOC111343280 n=1 Tax=Stylophora pistillata TaxID=50429 RepID=UPI000C04505A
MLNACSVDAIHCVPEVRGIRGGIAGLIIKQVILIQNVWNYFTTICTRFNNFMMPETRFSMIFPAIIITLAFFHMVTGSPGADPGSTLIRSIKDASKRIKVKRAGFGRGLKECRKQFKDELWDCSFYYENITRELPANRETAVIHAITTAGILQEIISQCAANEIIECSCNGRSRGSHECKNSLTFAVTETKSILRTRRQGNYE